MTRAVPEHPSRYRRWPWSSRTSARSDIAVSVLLFLGELATLTWATFSHGMTVWAAQGDQREIDAETLANIAWMQHFFYVVLALAVLSALSRAPWSLVANLLIALLVAALFTGAQHDYDEAHPDPTPTPGVHYTPCLSGSGTCH